MELDFPIFASIENGGKEDPGKAEKGKGGSSVWKKCKRFTDRKFKQKQKRHFEIGFKKAW